jgi:hypothetical protein
VFHTRRRTAPAQTVGMIEDDPANSIQQPGPVRWHLARHYSVVRINVSEVLTFLLIGPLLVQRIGPSGSMVLVCVAGVIRWTIAHSPHRPDCWPAFNRMG